MPVLNFDALDSVPEGLREYAKQLDGSDKFSVNVVAANKIDEFRDNNIAISKERDELLKAIEPLKAIVGDDIELFTQDLTELRTTAQRVKDGELKEGRSVEEAVGKRTDEMRKSFEERVQAEAKEKGAWKERYGALESRYRQGLVASAVKDACVAEGSGVEPSAIDDVISRAHSVFKAGEDGKITALDGDATIYGADGTSSMTPKEWLTKLRDEKPFFFKLSNGGGAGGSTTAKTTMGRTPEQIKAMTAAERLALANGEKTATL